eukprot:1158306-Pelagomonas_calceolata.AAC.9
MHAQVERVERDLSALSHAERAAALEADAPELLALLGDMEAGLGEIMNGKKNRYAEGVEKPQVSKLAVICI